MMKSRTLSLPEISHFPLYGNIDHLTLKAYNPEAENGKTSRAGDAIKIIEPVSLV